MSAFDTVLETLSKLSISPKTVSHDAVSDNKAWAEALTNTKDVSFEITKTLILKPKTAKTAAPTPVVVIALDATETNASALGKKLSLKDCRFASEDLLKDTFQAEKDSVSPFALSNVQDLSLIHLVVDSALLALPGSTLLAFHPSASDKTVFVTVDELKVFFQSIQKEWIEVDFKALAAAKPPATESKVAKAPKAAKKEAAPAEDFNQMGLGCRKEEDFPKWYQQVLTKSEMLEYYDVSGCYILRPLAYNVWKEITNFFDAEITEMGVEDTYFPMFVSNRVLQREKDHIEGFAPEVAWVTKAGSSDLEEPIAIRPTSETVMYPYFSKWIRSHRDLPFRINQWCSVVRWEFKNPQPFLRTREFLWQEGHTAHLNLESADKEVKEILDLYEQVYNDLLALPVVKGVKSEKERFAGGYYTTTVEGFIPTTGRAIQGGTSHCLGQNFSKMFNITVEDPSAPANATEEAKKLHVWQNSWGISTRTIGVMVMTHGDDKGLVMPPRVALIQTVIVPCGLTVKTTKEESDKIFDACQDVAARLKKAGLKSKADLRENYTPGFKFNHWEIRGVPLRLEVGPKDLEKNQVTCVRRDTGAKFSVSLDNLEAGVKEALDTIQNDMYQKAKKKMEDSIIRITKWEEFVPTLNNKKLLLVPWCDRTECEDDIKERSAKVANEGEEEDERAPSMGAKSLCKPFNQPTEDPIVPGVTKCIACEHDAKHFMLFGRSY
ncbi:putative proline--tRNA ligase C19C7.06 [Choanephora cucurbitarum]|uniref:proline--tRNA ligase n=1 Tax=Choanephora cucurbitarum TaxID=101091 RepID=A0A1C7NJ74_9FUNG|nr:putative proline--tRNA ligase C19C7.06 [Choanephora cucurbitarum]